MLKVSHHDTAEALLRRETRMMAVVAALDGVAAPAVVPTTDADAVTVRVGDKTHAVRLLSFIPGRALSTVRPKTPALLRQIGTAAGRLTGALDHLERHESDDVFPWDLRTASTTIAALAPEIPDPVRRELVTSAAERAAARIASAGPLPLALIHGDLNDNNLLLDGSDVGVIDFGDAHVSYRVAEVAIAASYAAFGFVDPVEAIATVVGGAADVVDLTDTEISLVVDLVILRLGLSVAFGAVQTAADPANDYLAVSQRAAWSTLERLAAPPPELAAAHIRHGAGLPAVDDGPFAAWMETNAHRCAPVLGVPMTPDTALPIDWSVTSPDAGDPTRAPAIDVATRDVLRRLEDSGLRFGVGRYGEPRLVYTAPEFVVPTNRGPGARTVHLGVDLTAPPGTTVHALLAGEVVRIDDEAIAGGYGPVVTLRHAPDDGPVFYTLSGHLSERTPDDVVPGDVVAPGDTIGTIGTPSGNGGWTPHLHFQIILDLLGVDGPFPGVALPDEWDLWSQVCPSPATALGLPTGLIDAPVVDPSDLLEQRQALLPPSLSTSYDEPLVAVRGIGARLYDGWGRAHLDCVNNVAHVGHGHPHVVAAAERQTRLLNTNSRYPHPERMRYMTRLAALFPAPLDTVFLVCTGSEANELALRLARSATGRNGVVALDGAYHGTTAALIDVSPYKHNGPGGRGTPPHVRVVPTPDVYRSAGGTDLEWHLAHIDTVLGAFAPAAFIAESLLGVAGQIEPPAGYLQGAYVRVRATGGLCIADEVQVGFGRIGSHMWGFERQGVIPDIVTLGKPIGNGHPLAAVVTTRAIATAFAAGMEYFNTFGGNPVSCAVGNAVLDVIEDERLQDHARDVGKHLMAGLRRLAATSPLIGDVRGAGLFLGVELVTDRAARTPAPAQATYIVNRARENRVLLSVDGPHHNVIKIKPPLPFTAAYADHLVALLEGLLAEDGAQPGGMPLPHS